MQCYFWFLVDGPGDEFPYVALINEQARVLSDGDELVGSDVVVGMSPAQLRVRIGG